VKTPPVEKEAHLSNYLWGGYVASHASADPSDSRQTSPPNPSTLSMKCLLFPYKSCITEHQRMRFGVYFIISSSMVIVLGFMLQPFSEVERGQDP